MRNFFVLNKTPASNTPFYMRLCAFKEYFDERVTGGDNYFFCSMPPFRGFKHFLHIGNKIVLDIRDGWSIAQATGYGGNVRSKPFKALITRQIERFMISRSFLTITCTRGLQEYLEELSGRQVFLIPNGISEEDYLLSIKLKKQKKEKSKDELVFCCAGQFSEYGADKVKKILRTIINRYFDEKIKIQLIGSNKEKNSWINDFLKRESGNRAYLEILPKKSRQELYEIMVMADYGMSILRDPSYDYGTKVYDYIALGLPVVNYFDEPNNFTNYFDACLDVPFNENAKIPEIRRKKLIENALKDVDF